MTDYPTGRNLDMTLERPRYQMCECVNEPYTRPCVAQFIGVHYGTQMLMAEADLYC